MDTWESAQDKVGFTTPVTKRFSQILGDVQAGKRTVNWVVHSQGGAIFSEAVRFNGGNLWRNSVIFHAGANNQLVTNYHLKNARINSGKETIYLNSPWDLVPNIVGLNTLNPIKITGSLLVVPSVIFGDPLSSPHTLPPAKPNKHIQGVTP
jgi:hypothetical protein